MFAKCKGRRIRAKASAQNISSVGIDFRELERDIISNLFFKFSLFQGYRIYRRTFLTFCAKVSYIPKSMRSKIIRFNAFLTCIYDHRVIICRKYYMKNGNTSELHVTT